MKKSMAFFTVAALVALLGCGKSEEGANTLVVQNYIGTVTIQGSGGSRQPEIGGSVAEGETVVTGGASSVDLVYNESALVRINENSSTRIDSVMATLKKSTDLSLQKGSIFTTVSKLKDDENFRVNTPTMVIAVRGTSFRVSSDDNISDTDVLSGTVRVNPVQDGKVVADVTNLVGENSRAEIRRDQISEIMKNRKIEVAAIRADRLQRLREDLNRVDSAVVDRLNPGLRKEFRMKLLQMRQDRFEMMEKQREDRMQKFIERKKAAGARIRERLLEKSLKREEKKALLEKRLEEHREKKEGLKEKILEKREERAEQRQEKKEAFIEKLREKKQAAAERRNEKLEEFKKRREEAQKKRRGGN